jgi:hypothetical protein
MALPTTTTKYAIRKKGKDFPITYSTSSNEGGYACVSVSHYLSTDNCESVGELVWYSDTKERATRVLNQSTADYNAGYETPNHDLDPKDYEVVQVMMTISKA